MENTSTPRKRNERGQFVKKAQTGLNIAQEVLNTIEEIQQQRQHGPAPAGRAADIQPQRVEQGRTPTLVGNLIRGFLNLLTGGPAPQLRARQGGATEAPSSGRAAAPESSGPDGVGQPEARRTDEEKALFI